MHCKKCGERLEQGDKFCKNCGQSQVAIMASEEGNNNNLLRSENRNNDIGDDIGNKNELISSDDSRAVTFKKKSFFNKLTFDEKKLVIGTLFDYDHPDGVNIRDFPVVDWEKCSVMLLAEIWGKEGSLESIFKEEK